jgi:hypothetical protein
LGAATQRAFPSGDEDIPVTGTNSAVSIDSSWITVSGSCGGAGLAFSAKIRLGPRNAAASGNPDGFSLVQVNLRKPTMGSRMTSTGHSPKDHFDVGEYQH